VYQVFKEFCMRKLVLVLLVLALATLACGPNFNIDVPRLETGPTETTTIDEANPKTDKAVDVELELGAGNLTLAGGADGLATGTIDTNVADWKPQVERTDSRLTIRQGEGEINFGFTDADKIVNKWDLQLGNDVLMDLTITAGAYDGQMELGGLSLERLTVRDGASSVNLSFDEPNQVEMDMLRYNTGASTVTLTGLANANFDDMSFDGGAGTYTLDFSGELQRDATVNVKAGVCTLTIIIPEGTAARINLDGGLTTVKTEGTWSASNDTYETSGIGPQLTINIDLGAATLTLINKPAE
jgi:hypothetical protein